MSDDRRRRLGGWGFEGEDYRPPAAAIAWLTERLGPTTPFPHLAQADETLDGPRPLPGLPGSSSVDGADRLRHARGLGFPDLIRLRSATVRAVPDAVLRPESTAAVAAVLAACARTGIRVIPWGGGTSVTGGVNVVPGDEATVALDLGRLAGLAAFDAVSGLARFGAGTTGPALEEALGYHGRTLGHFPQSFELSTLGGWVVTRSSGQESLGYGSIADMVAGLTLVAPAGQLDLPARPASAAGPDLRELVLGSEGRLGVVTDVTVRVRPRPERMEVWGALLPNWDAGLEASRALVQASIPLTLLRLSDAAETSLAMTLGLARRPVVAPLVRRYLEWRGAGTGRALLLFGTAGAARAVRRVRRAAHRVIGAHGGVSLGRSPGRHWRADRFRHPYLRDALLDRGIATDTLETAAPWSQVGPLARRIVATLERGLEPETEPVAVLCHVSHPYLDGASLYFTFFFRCPRDPEHAIARWARLKRVATDAVVAGGGTLSHHHGVGSWHAPWLDREIGADGRRVLAAAAHSLDPDGILNPHALLEPIDRLEV